MKLLLHTQSVMSLILSLTAMGMLVHLLRLRQPVRAKKWLIGFYLGFMLWQVENIVRYSMPLEYFNTVPYKLQIIIVWAPAIALTHMAHMQFAYYFLISAYERERKVVFWIASALWTAFFLYVVWDVFFNSSNLVAMLLAFFCCSLVSNLWINIVALRKFRYLRSVDQRASKAHLVYAAITLCYIVGCISVLFFDFNSPVRFWCFFLFVWFGILASIVLYIVYAAVPANFQTKVTGFTFVLAASVLSIFTLTFFPPVYPTDLPKRLAQQQGLSKMMIMIAGISVIIVLIVPFLLRISLTNPLRRLLAGVQKVNNGSLETQVAVGLPDEIGLLTENFNQMTQSMKKAQDELTQYAQTLEKKVANRTAQLQKSLDELRTMQSQLVQREKLASLGELTAGIAHEIKNPLNFINNFAEVNSDLIKEIKNELSNGNIEAALAIANDIEENERKISEHSKRADSIVKGMLQHSRSSTGQKEPTDINLLVDECLRLSYHGLRAKNKSFNAKLQTDFDENIGKINVISQDLGRVLLNLFSNAFYAVSEKNKEVQNGYDPTVSVQTLKKDDKVEIRIKDNGTGIPEKVVDKIFQPFFTTKPTGEGTGLGLSMSYEIITKGHNGTLTVETEEGQGTVFCISLPVQQ